MTTHFHSAREIARALDTWEWWKAGGAVSRERAEEMRAVIAELTRHDAERLVKDAERFLAADDEGAP